MYAFPTLELPEKFVEECKAKNLKADNVYCMNLLEEEGICCVSGSGFLQKIGTWHLRMNILEKEELMPTVVHNMVAFHQRLWNKYKWSNYYLHIFLNFDSPHHKMNKQHGKALILGCLNVFVAPLAVVMPILLVVAVVLIVCFESIDPFVDAAKWPKYNGSDL